MKKKTLDKQYQHVILLMEVMMTKVFKVCFTLAIVVGFYFFGYATTAIVHEHFLLSDVPEQTVSFEELTKAFESERQDDIQSEICEH
tara:strand:+ start:980 stop:1240 length:261 start_codon:yes stop_codon:yes gene_type:complete